LAAGFGGAFQSTISAIPHEGDKASKNPPVTTGEVLLEKSPGAPVVIPRPVHHDEPPIAPPYPNQPL
jgi:hypothetical protein